MTMRPNPSRYPSLRSLWLCSSLIMSACTTAPVVTQNSTVKPGSETGATQVATAVTSPLSDFNLVQTAIPTVLVDAAKNPYLAPSDTSCANLSALVLALDAQLAPDLDAPKPKDKPDVATQGSQAAGEAAVGAIRSTVEGLIPYRTWIRKLTGAERYSSQVSEAIRAGNVRRAYLKGVGQANHCTWPAAPQSAASQSH